MNDITQLQADKVEQRPIPRPPGGGSWTFDERAWEWVSNDPKPEPDEEKVQPPQAEEIDATAQAVGDDTEQPQLSQE